MGRAEVALLAGLLASAAGRAPAPTSITFFVASDSHIGARGMQETNRTLVEQMNALPGTPWPAAIGGAVAAPRGVLFTGDTTDNGLLEEFGDFERLYGLDGRDGLLRYPVFEAIGNHDLNADSPIKQKALARHGGIDYAWDWDDVRVICLDMYPDAATRRFLAGELSRRGRSRPLILFFHYSLEGPYSDFWDDSDKRAFAEEIAGYNVVAIFHGHEHRVGHYLWRGHPVFRPGSPRHSSHAFLAVRLDRSAIHVAAWDFDARRWLDSWTLPIRR